MKRLIFLGVAFLVVTALAGRLDRAMAGDTEAAKEESKGTVTQIKEGAVETGKAMAETGREIKEGSQKGWSEFKKDAVKTGVAVKEGAKEVGKEFKKAFQKTKAAVAKEFSGNDQNKVDEVKPEEKK